MFFFLLGLLGFFVSLRFRLRLMLWLMVRLVFRHVPRSLWHHRLLWISICHLQASSFPLLTLLAGPLVDGSTGSAAVSQEGSHAVSRRENSTLSR